MLICQSSNRKNWQVNLASNKLAESGPWRFERSGCDLPLLVDDVDECWWFFGGLNYLNCPMSWKFSSSSMGIPIKPKTWFNPTIWGSGSYSCYRWFFWDTKASVVQFLELSNSSCYTCLFNRSLLSCHKCWKAQSYRAFPIVSFNRLLREKTLKKPTNQALHSTDWSSV